MDTETFVKSNFGKLFIKILAAGMESRFRYRFFPPMKILRGTNIIPGQTVLELGCGTGFFTVPAAKLIGDKGSLTAMDVLQESVDLVTSKIREADLKNVHVVKGNAMDTFLNAESFDAVLLLGLIPAPMLPLNKLLPEIHRLLKIEGSLSVWPPVPGWLPQVILKSGLFIITGKCNGVTNFRRC